MRDPSLHITKSNLLKLINDITIDRKTSRKDIVDAIFAGAGQYQIRDRYLDILKSSAKTKKKVTRSSIADTMVNDDDIALFNVTLNNERKRRNNKVRIRAITKSDKQYLMLKEITVQADNFVKHFQISSKKEGYIEYVNIGLNMMPKYAINKFKYYDSKIYDLFDDKLLVITSNDRKADLVFYSSWQECLINYSGLIDMSVIDDDDYNKWAHIVRGRMQCQDVGASIEDWVEAQFSSMVFLNSIPELSQFYGEGAKNRYDKYLRDSVDYDEESDDNKSITDYYG